MQRSHVVINSSVNQTAHDSLGVFRIDWTEQLSVKDGQCV